MATWSTFPVKQPKPAVDEPSNDLVDATAASFHGFVVSKPPRFVMADPTQLPGQLPVLIPVEDGFALQFLRRPHGLIFAHLHDLASYVMASLVYPEGNDVSDEAVRRRQQAAYTLLKPGLAVRERVMQAALKAAIQSVIDRKLNATLIYGSALKDGLAAVKGAATKPPGDTPTP